MLSADEAASRNLVFVLKRSRVPMGCASRKTPIWPLCIVSSTKEECLLGVHTFALSFR